MPVTTHPCHCQHVRSDSPLSPDILCPFLVSLCLDLEGPSVHLAESKANRKTTGNRSKRRKSSMWQEGSLYPIKGRTRSVSTNNAGSSWEVPVLTCNEQLLSMYFQSTFIHQNIYSAPTVSRAWKPSEGNFGRRQTGSGSESNSRDGDRS